MKILWCVVFYWAIQIHVGVQRPIVAMLLLQLAVHLVLEYVANVPVAMSISVIIARPNGIQIRHAMQRVHHAKVQCEPVLAALVKIHSIVVMTSNLVHGVKYSLLKWTMVRVIIWCAPFVVRNFAGCA